jgi:hypothetical protein
MNLFREDVYQKIQHTSNLERGIEEALAHIVNDNDLQTAIRNYAIQNEISHKGYGIYGSGVYEYCGRNNTFKDRRIIFWKRTSPVTKNTPVFSNKKKDLQKMADELYIGPDSKQEIMPIYLRFWELNDESSPWAPMFVYSNIKIQHREDKFYLEKDKSHPIEIAGRRVIDVPFLQGKPSGDFLKGLEKALSTIIKE